MATRLLLGAAAAAVAVWLGLTFGSERLEAQATRVAAGGGEPSRAEVDDALRKARDARAWQPDSGPKLVEARLLASRGEARRAEALLQEVTRGEPANAEAWFYLAHSTDPRLRREGNRRFRELRPR